MKKLLLSLSAAVIGVSAMAMEPTVYPGEAFVAFSPNGQYGVSFYYDRIAVYDFVSGQHHVFDPTDDGSAAYMKGNGNCISNDGVLVGSQTYMMDMSYYKDGEWHFIESVKGKQGSVDGITPDGSRICGSIAPPEYGGSMMGLMRQPVIFDRQDDGTYGEPVYLPFPEVDMTGRVPQYVTALCISDDGKTIAGQQQDNYGGMAIPVIYHQDENGMWTYTIPNGELYKIDGIEFPEDPGEHDYVQLEAFMSEEHLAAYNAAVEEWSLLGLGWDEYPAIEAFASEEEIAAYNAAAEEYNEWVERLTAFQMVYEQYVQKAPSFVYNNVAMTPDGTKVALTRQVLVPSEDPWSRSQTFYAPYCFNLEAKTYTASNPSLNVIVSDIAADGTVIGATPMQGQTPPEAYILLAGSDQWETLYNYYASVKPGLAAWMKENMTHEVTTLDWETWEEKTDVYMITGIPFCSDDMSIVSTYAENVWDFDDENMVFSYVFTPELSGVKSVIAQAAVTVRSLGEGVIAIEGDAAAVEVYDLSGRLVYSAAAPGASVETGLGAGVYMVSVKDAAGASKVAKVAF